MNATTQTLDAATKTATAFGSFDELRRRCLEGYVPTLDGSTEAGRLLAANMGGLETYVIQPRRRF